MPIRTQKITLVLLIVAVFGVSLLGDFVWDDRALTVDNVSLSGSLTDAISTPFLVDGSGAGAYWRPVVTLALWTQVQVFGSAPMGYHLVNLLLHMGITLLVFGWLRRRVGEESIGPWLGAALFAVHSSRPESVAWIAGSTDLWMSLFVLLGVTLWDRRTSMAHSLGVGLLFALGLWSKETAVVALPILLLEAGLKNGKDNLPWKDAAVAGFPLALALGIRFWMGGVGEGGEAIVNRALLALSALGHYLHLLVWPGDLTVQVGARMMEGGEEVFSMLPMVGGGLFSLLVGGLWWNMSRGGESARAGRGDLLWLVFPLLPVLHLLPLGTPWVASARYLYLPLLGVASLVARGMSREVPERLPVLVGVVIGLFGLSSTFHTLNFQTDKDLWIHESELHPDSATAWENLGHAHYRDNRKEDAADAWGQGIQKVPAWNEQGRERLGLLLLREMGSGLKPWQQDDLKRHAQFYTDLLDKKEVPWDALVEGAEPGGLQLESVDDPELIWIPAGQAAQRMGQLEEAQKRFLQGTARRATSQLLWAERQRTAALEGDWSRVETLFQEARQVFMNPDWGKEWQGQLWKGQQMATHMPLPADAPAPVGEVLKSSRLFVHLGAPQLAYGALDGLMGSGGDKVVSFWVTRIQLDVSQGAMERALQTLAQAREAMPEALDQWNQFEAQLQGQMRRDAPGR